MHDDFIKALGGSGAVAKYCGVGVQVANNWRSRGVAWPYRQTVATLASIKKVSLPEGFLDPRVRGGLGSHAAPMADKTEAA